MIQYKQREQSNWIMLSNHIIPEQNQVVISDLTPASWYDLAITSNSEAGSVDAQYQYATLTLDGGEFIIP